MVKDYVPQAHTAKMLDYALSRVKSVPYKVSGRWVFYQLVQAGLLSKKDAKRFDAILSRARKRFWGGWQPDILRDSVRHCEFNGEGYVYFDLKLDSIENQEYYVQLWFEAAAMYEQFEYYTKDYRVSLVPFRGDASIPQKWEIAKKIEAIATKYGKPLIALYFGDYDLKGLKIYEAAVRDIMEWCRVPFAVQRVGLTLEQARELDIPDNPQKPGTYQWEALNDEQAGRLITNALSRYYRKVPSDTIAIEKRLNSRISQFINNTLEEEGI